MLHAPASEARESTAERGRAMAPRLAASGLDVAPPFTGNQALLRTRARGREGMLQRRAVLSPVAYAPPAVDEVLRTPGQPLDSSTRGLMESMVPTHLSKIAPAPQSRMVIGPAADLYEREADTVAERVAGAPSAGASRNHDFSRVRIHTGAKADASARAVGALAYTVGPDIVFAAGQYAPATARGRNLLAHELSHTVQQTRHSPAVLQRETGDAATIDSGSPAVGAGVPAVASPAPVPLQDAGAPDAGAPDAGVAAGLSLPTNADEQLLAGTIFAESSTSGGADEKLCIGLCAKNMAYYATLAPPKGKTKCYNDAFGDGTLLGAIKKGFPQSYKSARWNVVMDGDKLKTEAKITAVLQAADMTHFKACLTAAADTAKATAPAADPTSKKIPIQFNQATDGPPSSRQEKIATYKPHTFYGFKAGRECD